MVEVTRHSSVVSYDIAGLSETQAQYLVRLLGKQTTQGKRGLGFNTQEEWDGTYTLFHVLDDAVHA